MDKTLIPWGQCFFYGVRKFNVLKILLNLDMLSFYSVLKEGEFVW